MEERRFKEQLYELIGEGRSRMAAVDGDVDEGTVYCGQIGGIVTELAHAGDVVKGIIAEAQKLVKGLERLAGA